MKFVQLIVKLLDLWYYLRSSFFTLSTMNNIFLARIADYLHFELYHKRLKEIWKRFVTSGISIIRIIMKSRSCFGEIPFRNPFLSVQIEIIPAIAMYYFCLIWFLKSDITLNKIKLKHNIIEVVLCCKGCQHP